MVAWQVGSTHNYIYIYICICIVCVYVYSLFIYSSRTTMIDKPEIKSFWDTYYPNIAHHWHLLRLAVMYPTLYPEKTVANLGQSPQGMLVVGRGRTTFLSNWYGENKEQTLAKHMCQHQKMVLKKERGKLLRVFPKSVYLQNRASRE